MADFMSEEVKKKVYTAAKMPSYTAQTDAVNSVYDRALEAQLRALQGSYDTSRAALEKERPAIARDYQAAGNETAAQSERAKQAWGEYAAASGLNSGAGGQAELARSVKLQGDLADIRRSEAEANTALDNEILKLQLEYEGAVAKARADGDYARAAALLAEYQRAEQSRISAANSQADEEYRAYTAGRSAASEEAKNRAKYGDFSGYAALGYSDEAIAGMSSVWAMQNPLLAYNLGRISANEYYRYTGKYPAGYGYRGGRRTTPATAETQPDNAGTAGTGARSAGGEGRSYMAVM